MSELTLTLLRFAYLAVLWIFVLSAISVVRSDMFGARVDSAGRRILRQHAHGPAVSPAGVGRRRRGDRRGIVEGRAAQPQPPSRR